jgi:HlyD family secretion protein
MPAFGTSSIGTFKQVDFRMNSSRRDLALPEEKAQLALIRSFGSESGEIRAAPEPVSTRLTLFLVTGLLFALIGLSAVFDIDRVVTSVSAQIVTIQPTILLQALDPSIIKTIAVEEGQRVKAGQTLVTLDPTFTAADASALQQQVVSLDAQIARGEAELAGRPLVYPPSDDPTEVQYRKLQKSYYDQQKMQYDAQMHAFDEQIAQARATMEKLHTDMTRFGDRVQLARQVEDIRSKLQIIQFGSLLNYLSAKDARVEIERSVEQDRNSLVETEHQLGATIANRDAFVQQWLGQASQDLVTTRNTRDSAMGQLVKAVRHRDLVRIDAPDDCVVLSLAKLSVGSVLKEGDPIVTLALLNVPMEVEIGISARDIGFVRPGDRVSIKLDAFDFVEHGMASGRIRWISEGTFNTDLVTGSTTDAKGAPIPPFYKAQVQLDPVNLKEVPPSFRLIPGMTLSVDVHVGTHSLLMYLARGVVRGVDEAMREP